jgi:tRNA(fMet)-specific endonuclease VapC
MLDTNVVSHAIRDPQGRVARRWAEVGVQATAVSIVVASELRFGLAKVAYTGRTRLAERVEQVLLRTAVLPLDAPCDAHYGDIRASLERAGMAIGPNDLLIAAHARALGLTLVTNNTNEFARVAGLQFEDWSL